MAHLPYADIDSPDVQPLVERIARERGSVLHLYQMLLHSPPVCEGWLTYLTAIRQKTTLPGALRELIIMRVAVLNGAPYEAQQHRPIALKEGMRPAQLDALDTWQESAEFSDVERIVLGVADAMTRDIHVPAPLMAQMREALGARHTVEAVATVAAYNMVSRFLEALHVDAADARPHDGVPPSMRKG